IHKGPVFLSKVTIKIALALQSRNKQQSKFAYHNKIDGLCFAVQLHRNVFQYLIFSRKCKAFEDGFYSLLSIVPFGKAEIFHQIPCDKNCGTKCDNSDE